MNWLIKSSLSIMSIILLCYQTTLLIRPNKAFFFADVREYFVAQIQSPLATKVTESIRNAELRNNSLLNVVRFATGWGEQNDLNYNYIFAYRSLYFTSIFGIILGLIPFALILAGLLSKKSFFHDNKTLITLYIVAIVLSSTYFLIFLDFIPYFRDAFRWVSSKTWILLYVPGSLLALKAFQKLKPNTYLAIIILTFLTIYSFTWVTGALISKTVLVKIPQEYSLLSSLQETDILVVLPKPQVLFFRNYEWGYYGTDFVSYITKAKVLDETTVTSNTEVPNKDIYLLASSRSEIPQTIIDTCKTTELQREAPNFLLIYCRR